MQKRKKLYKKLLKNKQKKINIAEKKKLLRNKQKKINIAEKKKIIFAIFQSFTK